MGKHKRRAKGKSSADSCVQLKTEHVPKYEQPRFIGVCDIGTLPLILYDVYGHAVRTAHMRKGSAKCTNGGNGTI